MNNQSNIILGLILSVCASSAVYAQDTRTERQGQLAGAYIGLDMGLSTETELDDTVSADNDAAFNLNFGYDFSPKDKVVVGIEVEYRSLGEATYYNILDVEGTGLSINVKPKFYPDGNTAYIGVMAGLGAYSLEATSGGVTVMDESETAMQYGVEIGYEFEQGLVLSGSYRMVDFGDVAGTDVTNSGFFVGMKYKY